MDDDIDLGQRFGQGAGGFRVGDVELERIATNLVGELAAALQAPRGGDGVEAGGGKGAYGRGADAARRTRHERDSLAFEVSFAHQGDLRWRPLAKMGA